MSIYAIETNTLKYSLCDILNVDKLDENVFDDDIVCVRCNYYNHRKRHIHFFVLFYLFIKLNLFNVKG